MMSIDFKYIITCHGYFFFFYIGVLIFATSDSIVYKNYPSMVQTCKMLSASGVKPVENFACCFFIDSYDRV